MEFTLAQLQENMLCNQVFERLIQLFLYEYKMCLYYFLLKLIFKIQYIYLFKF